MTRALYPFQESSVKFHLAHHYSLNCSEMGLGKSLMALESARRAGKSVLIFGPAFLSTSWHSEAAMVGVKFRYTPYSQIKKLSLKEAGEYDFWIADEVHYLKSPTAQRTHYFYSLIQSVKPEYFIGLTGTPIKNRVPDFWTLLAFCSLNKKDTNGKKLTAPLDKYHAFARHFCHLEKMKFRGATFIKYKGVREDRVPELKELLRGKYIRHRVEDVLKELPPMVRKNVELDMSPVAGLEEEFSAYTRGNKGTITAKVTSAVLKAPKTVEYIRDMIESEVGNVLVFTDHVDSAKAIYQGLKGSALITGQTPMKERQAAVSAFQDGICPVIVATIGALSVGVTLTKARHVVFNDLSWTPSDNLQAEKRIHRIGQKDVCFSHYMIASPTDAIIHKALMSKLDSIDKVIG